LEHTVIERLEKLSELAKSALKAAQSKDALFQLKAQYLGKKGELSEILKGLKDLSAEERPKIGEHANRLRDTLDRVISERLSELEDAEIAVQLKSERIDVTLPGKRRYMGAVHPLSQTIDRLLDVFNQLGFSYVTGPEIETEFCNFEALNVPDNHPARDMQDTLYVKPGILLRTQTSSMQIRAMLAQKPPLKVVMAGAVYRRDSVDATHTPMFHQMEGLCIDKNVTMEELKGALEHFARQLFGANTKIRMRSSFFPFTEPSVEVDCTCVFCAGKGCKVCKHSGWIEILGAGMVHPNVFEQVGYAPGEVTGFAFGLGIERIAMLVHDIDDIRYLYENDLRFLEQFV
jgi:phenylalanyl-tRNA synthetase alpha chain